MSLSPLPKAQSILKTGGHNIRALLVVLAIMAFLAGLALLFSRATLRVSDDWQSQLSDSLTVQVTLRPFSEDNDFRTQMQAAEDVLKTLIDPKADINIIDQEASDKLLQPWIGNLQLPDSLTLPGLISVKGDASHNIPSARNLERRLNEAGVIAVVDDHSRWSDQIGGTARLLVLGGTTLLGLLLIASISVSLFATRAAMAAQRSIISVLSQVGATDGFVARIFIGQAGRRSAVGTGIGLILAWIIWAILSLLGLSSDIFWSNLSVCLTDTLWLGALWALFSSICALAAGITTQYALRQERKKA